MPKEPTKESPINNEGKIAAVRAFIIISISQLINHDSLNM